MNSRPRPWQKVPVAALAARPGFALCAADERQFLPHSHDAAREVMLRSSPANLVFIGLPRSLAIAGISAAKRAAV